MTQEITDTIRRLTVEVRQSVIDSVDEFNLDELLTNPYLWAAFFKEPEEFIRFSLQSSLVRSMQTKFGNLLEEISVRICGGNVKSGTDGIDLDLMRNMNRLLVSTKSGATWGNSQSTKKQGDQFKKAKKTISQSNGSHEIISVMGICCGNKKTSHGLQYADVEVCGQNYWYLISGNKNFYKELITEIAFGNEKFGDELRAKFDEVCNKLITEFNDRYTDLFSDPAEAEEIWSRVVFVNCGNYSDRDQFLRKVMA